MAFPALLGIPWLATILASLFVAIVSFFAEFLTKRLAVILAVVVALSALTLAFFAGMVGIVSGLTSISPPGMSQAIGLMYPENANLIAATIFTARLARWVYEWNVKVLQMRLF